MTGEEQHLITETVRERRRAEREWLEALRCQLLGCGVQLNGECSWAASCGLGR